MAKSRLRSNRNNYVNSNTTARKPNWIRILWLITKVLVGILALLAAATLFITYYRLVFK